jgi:hypothetical protein
LSFEWPQREPTLPKITLLHEGLNQPIENPTASVVLAIGVKAQTKGSIKKQAYLERT